MNPGSLIHHEPLSAALPRLSSDKDGESLPSKLPERLTGRMTHKDKQLTTTSRKMICLWKDR